MVDPEPDEAAPPPAQGPADGPQSGTRGEPKDPADTDLSITEPSGRDPDTLMSLPRPSPRHELPLEVRVNELEDRLRGHETRLSLLERGRDPLASSRATPWWFWLLFLLGLAITWRLLQLLR